MANDSPPPQPSSDVNELFNRAVAALATIEKMVADANASMASITLNQEKLKAAADSATAASGEIAPTLAQAKALLDAATKTSTEIPPAAEKVKQSATEVSPLLEGVKTSRSEVLTLVESIKTDAAKTNGIAKVAAEADARVKAYENNLQESQKNYDDLLKKLEELLPAATGVGLAKSFSDRKRALAWPRNIYLSMFIFSILGFIALGLWGLFNNDIHDLEDFMRFFFERSPIIVGLVLLEEFSRRQFAATVRLEEDYAYKETISISFDGYKKAMKEMESSAAASLPSIFSQAVINTLKDRPGRLIDGEEKDIFAIAQLLQGGQDKAEQPAAKSSLIDLVTDALQAKWIKGSIALVLVLIIGLLIGYYVAAREMPHRVTNVDAAVTVNPPSSSEKASKGK